MQEKAKELLQGGYDLHVHTIPSHFQRSLDDIQLARQCDEGKMAGALIKSHYEPTAGRALLANRYSGARARLWGGIALNWPVGGLNPYAVESACRLGARIVWLPTRDSENCLRYGDMHGDFFARPPVCLTDAEGRLKKALYEVMEVVKKYDAWLATGHISPQESLLVCQQARANKVNTILTHPDWVRTVMPLENQLQLAKLGVLVEKVGLNITKGYISAEKMAESLKALGGDSVYLVTDLGQKGNARPLDGMADFVAEMLRQGVAADQLKKMVRDNPARIVGR